MFRRGENVQKIENLSEKEKTQKLAHVAAGIEI